MGGENKVDLPLRTSRANERKTRTAGGHAQDVTTFNDVLPAVPDGFGRTRQGVVRAAPVTLFGSPVPAGLGSEGRRDGPVIRRGRHGTRPLRVAFRTGVADRSGP